MFKNYFKIAWRNLWKNKTASVINIVGLTTGITCCLLMVLYLQHELSYDKFQKNSDRIARVIMEYSFGDAQPTKGNFTSTKVLPAFKSNFPEVVGGVRMAGNYKRLVKYKDDIYNEDNFTYADSTFFEVFPSFELISGKPKEVLKNPKSIVLNETMAKKYFGSVDQAVGKILQIGASQDNFEVTGVTKDCPSNSQIKYSMLVPFSNIGDNQERTYFNANYTTYLLMRDEAAIASLQKKLPAFMKKEITEKGVYIGFFLEPYTSIHLHSPYDGFEANSNITYVYIIAAIAILILSIACFTYINLSTARSMERAREVGIRKVSGAVRGQVFWQFICESLLVTLLATMLSIVASAALLPAFNRIADRQLDITGLWSPYLIAALAGIVIVISLLAGSYPALILSNFQPIKVLKGAFKNTGSGVVLRRSLIVFQFMISVFLIVATFVIQQQLHFIQNKKLGYDREHVLLMSLDQKLIDKIDLVKTELKTNPDIVAVSKANNTPVSIIGGYAMYRGDQGADKAINTRGNPIDNEYVKANGLEIIAGSDLTRQDILDANHDNNDSNYFHYIINEAAVNALGWKTQEAIGKKLYLGGDRPGEVKAVVRDFHFASLHNKVEPLVMFPGGWGNNLIIRTSGNNLASTIAFLGAKWKELAPHRPFEYRFMDEDFQRLYTSEMRTGKVFTIFAAIAILLACLGLFGLSAYAAQQRLKEIGVRKVLGASVFNIVFLLSNNFVKLVALAFVIITPITWYFINSWLQDFAYRVNIEWWIFLLAGLAVLTIALLTVGIQAIKAAWMNPVKSLRTE